MVPLEVAAARRTATPVHHLWMVLQPKDAALGVLNRHNGALQPRRQAGNMQRVPGGCTAEALPATSIQAPAASQVHGAA